EMRCRPSPPATKITAIEEMMDAPEPTVSLLKERVKPVVSSDARRVAKLIAQLGSDEFDERQRASASLEEMGEGTAHLLAKGLEGGGSSLETRKRLEELLAKCEKPTTLRKQQQ